MAYNKSSGLSYFPLEVSVFQDIKVRKLMKYQGGKSFTIYTHLLCNIYQNGYYLKWDSELPFIIGESTGFEEGYINEVIRCCFNVGLFSKEIYEKYGVITSKGIQDRYVTICKMTKKKFVLSDYVLKTSEELPKTSEELPKTSEELPKTSEELPKTSEELPQRKEKKNKEEINKEISDFAPPTEPHDFNYKDKLFNDLDVFVYYIKPLGAAWKLQPYQIRPMLEEFDEYIQRKEKLHGNIKDYVVHFGNWGNTRFAPYQLIEDPQLIYERAMEERRQTYETIKRLRGPHGTN